MKPIEQILVATDFSPCAHAAADLAARLAQQVAATVHVMTMVDTSAAADAPGDAAYRRYHIDRLHGQSRERLQAFADEHFGPGAQVQIHVVDGGSDPNASRDIVRVAQELQCGLIVLGTHGKTGIEHLVIGSVAEKVVRTSAIPVLTVRRA